MPPPRDKSLGRLTTLILAPVFLLAAIAVFGLVEYRHSVTEDARAEAAQYASAREVARALGALQALTEEQPEVRIYETIPTTTDTPGEHALLLESATAAGNREAHFELLDSNERTVSGLPVCVLAAWQILEIEGGMADAERLADFAIHKFPSAITNPILDALHERFPKRTDWEAEWQLTEERREIIQAHPDSIGLVPSSTGPAFIVGNRVLTARETRSALAELSAAADPPAWMALEYVALDQRQKTPTLKPLLTAGTDLKIIAGVLDSEALYSRYWRVVWWVAALILCAFLTALAGILLTRRTVNRERRLHELKSQFVASVSHELRAPVASMRLMADALDAGRVQGRKASEFHRLISQEGARLSSLIENVLEFARIEEGKKHYKFSETDLPALLRDTVKLMEPVAHERAITINTSLPESAPSSTLDAHAIQQAVINLLDNAIKFSPGGSAIEVVLEVTQDDWQLTISDNGPGIAREHRARVFERFVRLENELQRETQGAGIGLSIVKHTIDAHGGGVHSESNAEGGTTFVLRCGNCGPVRDGQEECSSQELALEQPRELKTRDVPS